jgi:hypothetical protein
MSWLLIAISLAVIAVVRTFKSRTIEPPACRVLFILVLVGLVLTSMLPEARFIIPAIDVVGLDIVTILVALELSHYLMFVGRMLGVPKLVAVYHHAPGPAVARARDICRTNPRLWLYACSWAWISLLAFLGNSSPRAK